MADLGVSNSMFINELCLFSLPFYLQTNDLLSLEIYIAPNHLAELLIWCFIMTFVLLFSHRDLSFSKLNGEIPNLDGLTNVEVM